METISVNNLSDTEFWEAKSRLDDMKKAFFIDRQITENKFCVIASDRKWLKDWLKDNNLPKSIDLLQSLRRDFNMELGVRLKWWESWDKRGPIPFPKVFKLSEFNSVAQVLVELKVFPSLSQARKNGFDKPLTLGDHTLTSKKIRITVIE